MLTAETQIDTERPGRYLAQLCRHAAAMGGARSHRLRAHAGAGAQAGREGQVHAVWSEADGAISFDPWGKCTIAASADRLVLRVEAADEENLRRIQDVLTRDIDRFGRRERLTVNWHSPEAPGAERGEEPAG
jgi:hypothetical protein